MLTREQIASQITFGSPSTQVAPEPTETPAAVETPVTVADGGEQKVQEVVEHPQSSEDKKSEPASSENKSKEERREEGTKIERKLGEFKRRALEAETELREYKAQLAKEKAAKPAVDLDELSFDERIEHVASTKAEERDARMYEQRLNSQAQQATAQLWDEQIREISTIKPDYQDKVAQISPYLDRLHPQIQQAISKSDMGAALVYELASNPEAFVALVNAGENPYEAGDIIAGLKYNIRSSTPAQAPVQSTPAVMATPKPGSAPVAVNSQQALHSLPFEEFMRVKNAARGR